MLSALQSRWGNELPVASVASITETDTYNEETRSAGALSVKEDNHGR